MLALRVVSLLAAALFIVGHVPLLRRAAREDALSPLAVVLQAVGLLAGLVGPYVIYVFFAWWPATARSGILVIQSAITCARLCLPAGYLIMLLAMRRYQLDRTEFSEGDDGDLAANATPVAPR
jgi:hypothetical protein